MHTFATNGKERMTIVSVSGIGDEALIEKQRDEALIKKRANN